MDLAKVGQLAIRMRIAQRDVVDPMERERRERIEHSCLLATAEGAGRHEDARVLAGESA